MRLLPLLLLVVVLISPPLAAAESSLRSYTAEYKVSASGLDLGKLTVRLQLDQGRYRYTKKTDASGLMKWISNDELQESSEGRLEGGEPIPETYHYLHTRRKGTKEESAVFSDKGIEGHYNQDAFTLPWQKGIQDKASQDIELMLNIAAETESLAITVIDKGRLRHQVYRVEGKETLEIAGKAYETIKLIVERSNSARQTHFWLAPELGNIPVQFSHKDGEDKPRVQSRLVRLKIRQES